MLNLSQESSHNDLPTGLKLDEHRTILPPDTFSVVPSNGAAKSILQTRIGLFIA